MCSRFPSWLLITILCVATWSTATAEALRVCADPDNLPYSNRKLQGFENYIARLIARDLKADLSFVWVRQQRGLVRDFLNSRECDLLVGVPQQFRPVLTTSPYYTSSFVFVTRKDRNLHVASLDDPRLRKLRIGVQVLAEEYAPPAQALARRGLLANLVGFETVGSTTRQVIDALAHNQIDVAVLWGPVAGYYARSHRSHLELTPVSPAFDPPALPMTFAISLGVRKQDVVLHHRLEEVLARRASEIAGMLRRYGVPQVDVQVGKAWGGR